MCYTSPVLRQEESKPPRIALVGPTASGKTAVGVSLAEILKTEIVSADSMQVYRRMDIGTAKPTAAERSQVPFHALDVAEPDDDWTLTDFQRLGEAACDALETTDRSPLIVGGTGLYVRALTTNLDIPQTPPNAAFREHWRVLAETHGSEFVRQALARVDSEAAQRIHINDLKRQIRALEVYEATGVPLSEWHARNKARNERRNVRLFGLNFADRRRLYARIEARVDQMINDGFLDEVRGLLAAGCERTLKPMQSLGYRQLTAFLAGEVAWEDAIEQIQRETRHFARRQLIWFRGDARVQWLEAADKTPHQLTEEIRAHLSRS